MFLLLNENDCFLWVFYQKAVLRNVVREASLPSSFLSILFPVFISSIYREKLVSVMLCVLSYQITASEAQCDMLFVLVFY